MSGRRAQSLPGHMHEPVKAERGRCVTAICFSWKVITCVVSHVTLVLLVVSYCVGGAYLFQHLERPHEIEVKKGIHILRLNLTDKIWTHSDNLSVLNEETWTSVVKDDLQLFEKQILTAIKTNGWDGDEDITKSQWTFAGSLFYSIIVITTIGYGHISPRTDWGKVTTIFYAIVGIPLMLLCLSNIGDIMATSFRFIYWRVCCYICTRTAKKNRLRSRQRSTKGHRYSSRSQPPAFRRSVKMSQRSKHVINVGGGLQHAYSDPELRTVNKNTYERGFDYEYQTDRRSHRGGSDRKREHMMNMVSPPRINTQHMPVYDDSYYIPEDDPSYIQTLNRPARFRSRQRTRDRMCDRHTIERERHLSRSKQYFDSMEGLDDFPRTKRSTSVRSVRSMNPRKDYVSKYRDPRELNKLNSHHIAKEKLMLNSNGRIRSKSVDPRLSAPLFEQVDDEVVRKTPIISNRYAIDEMEHHQSKNKSYLRSQSMPRAAIHKSTLNHLPPKHYEGESPSHINNQQYRRSSLGRQMTQGTHLANARYGHHLELPELGNFHGQRIKRAVSPRRFSAYPEDYDEPFLEEPEDQIRMSRRSFRGYNDVAHHSPKSSNHMKKYPRKERQERLPPSPRIMSPMGFAVKRQIRRRSSYDYDDDSQYGDEWSDFYGNISPKDRPVPIWLCVFLVISYILGGAALFAYWEEWSFLDSAYFCFITLTTIGFGDFVPAKGVKDESEQSIAYCSLYLLFGIALLAMSFNLVQEEFIANVKELARRLGILKDEDDQDDD